MTIPTPEREKAPMPLPTETRGTNPETPAPMTEKLEPCPFCGDHMKAREHSAFHPPATIGKEWCWLSTAGEHGTPYELDEGDYAAWNRRHRSSPSTAAEAEIERLQAMWDEASRGWARSGIYAEQLEFKLKAAEAALETARVALALIKSLSGSHTVGVHARPVSERYDYARLHYEADKALAALPSAPIEREK